MRACVRAARSIQATVEAGKRNFKWPLFVVNFVHRTPAFINVHEIVHIFLIDVLTTRSCATKKPFYYVHMDVEILGMPVLFVPRLKEAFGEE